MNSLKTWFRQRVFSAYLSPLRSVVYERICDLDHILRESEENGDYASAEVKLWNVYRMHGPEIKKVLDKLCRSEMEFGVGDSTIEAMGR